MSNWIKPGAYVLRGYPPRSVTRVKWQLLQWVLSAKTDLHRHREVVKRDIQVRTEVGCQERLPERPRWGQSWILWHQLKYRRIEIIFYSRWSISDFWGNKIFSKDGNIMTYVEGSLLVNSTEPYMRGKCKTRDESFFSVEFGLYI